MSRRTPVRVQEMEPWLASYPDVEAAAQLRFGFTHGFFIPFCYSRAPSFGRNLKSAEEFPDALREKVSKEVSLGRLRGPFLSPPFPNLRVSPLGVVPKREEGKYRLIQHLSHPKGSSVNDGILSEDSSVTYVSFDRAVSLVRKAGRGALMAKSDIESAFRLLPVHADCFHLLGCFLDGCYYYDTCLPMGCSISCYYFELFSTFLEWVVKRESGLRSVTHYLDDFLFVSPAESDGCAKLLSCFCQMMARFGVPLSAEKTSGPVTVLSFLGIEIDTQAMVFRLPVDKLRKLEAALDAFMGSSKVTLKQAQSLLGLLAFAGRVLPMGRAFARRLSLATKGLRCPDHHFRVTRPLKLDMAVWRNFLAKYNGRTCFLEPEVSNASMALYTDAAGSVGFGAVLGDQWCAEQWPQSWREAGLCSNLTLLEFFPIVVAIEVWPHCFANRKVIFWTDNISVVHCVNNQSSSSLPVLALLRHLVLRCLENNVWFRARHVPGVENKVADSLSRFNMQDFRRFHPTAASEGMACPDFLWDLPLTS